MKHISYEMAIQFALEDELIFPYDLLTREDELISKVEELGFKNLKDVIII